MRCHHALLAFLPLLAGCADSGTTQPVTVAVPGLPSPELALQRSLDRVHAFMSSLDQRLATPVKATHALATADAIPSAPLNIIPADITDRRRQPVRPALSSDAAPVLFGKRGTAWIPFGQGYTLLRCAPLETCIVRLERGERVSDSAQIGQDLSTWHVDVVRGTHGIHAAWAVAISPGRNAQAATLHFTTNRRRYALGLLPEGPSMSSVAFTYGPGDPSQQAEPPLSKSSGATQTDFAYAVTGPDAPFKPLRVYREGPKTYVQFSAEGVAARPRLTVLAPHSERPAEQHIVGNSYVIDGRIDRMILSTGSGQHRIAIHISHKKDPHNA